jgi:hypothetical protein
MPRKWNGFKPHEKLTPDNIEQHLEANGIDPKDFQRFAKADIDPGVIQKFFPKADGTKWNKGTLAHWKELVREQER